MLIHTHAAALPVREGPSEMLPVAIITPYNPKMTPKRECESRLKLLCAKAEHELLARYPADVAMPVIRRVQQAVRNLNGNTHKSSVAIFVTGDDIQTLYMNIPVEETLIIDTPFAVKDVLDCRVDEREFLVLVLSRSNAQVYLLTGEEFRMIKTNSPQGMYGDREVMLEKFLHHIDEGLESVLAGWPRPVFVIGDPRVTGHFKKLTHHGKNIVDYIHQDAAERHSDHWKKYLGPYLAEWEKVRESHALHLVEKAIDSGKLVAGIAEVARQARGNNSRLLVVEKRFTGTPDAAHGEFGFTDAVDRIIWQVLANGGNVERVEPDSLKDLGRIALVKYY